MKFYGTLTSKGNFWINTFLFLTFIPSVISFISERRPPLSLMIVIHLSPSDLHLLSFLHSAKEAFFISDFYFPNHNFKQTEVYPFITMRKSASRTHARQINFNSSSIRNTNFHLNLKMRFFFLLSSPPYVFGWNSRLATPWWANCFTSLLS